VFGDADGCLWFFAGFGFCGASAWWILVQTSEISGCSSASSHSAKTTEKASKAFATKASTLAIRKSSSPAKCPTTRNGFACDDPQEKLSCSIHASQSTAFAFCNTTESTCYQFALVGFQIATKQAWVIGFDGVVLVFVECDDKRGLSEGRFVLVFAHSIA
jgi:hypothetical protein